MSHTKEPWIVDDPHQVYAESIGEYVAITDVEEDGRTPFIENACRIVACVNACAGMADPAAEIAALRAEVEQLKAAAVPAGWQMVPVEPTLDMLRAMQSSGWMPANYNAMLAAAPTPPQSADAEDAARAINTDGPRGTYGCACLDRDSVQCAAIRYGMDHFGEACECMCHQWDDDDAAIDAARGGES